MTAFSLYFKNFQKLKLKNFSFNQHDTNATFTPNVPKKQTPSKEFQDLKSKLEEKLLGSKKSHTTATTCVGHSSAARKNLYTKSSFLQSECKQARSPKKNSLAIHLCENEDDYSDDQVAAPKPKSEDKSTDLEFKNELDCLFSITIPHQVKRRKPAKPTSRDKKNFTSNNNGNTNDNTKLISLFRSIGGHLIKDHTDLLVDYDTKPTRLLSNSLGSCSLLSNRSRATSPSLSDSLNSSCSSSTSSSSASFASSLDTTRSVDNTLKLLRFSKTDIDSRYVDDEMTRVQNEKILNLVIKLLAKSCFMFDVATMKSENEMHYWRYANPLVAACKRTKNAVGYSRKKCDKAIQTGSVETRHG